MHRRDFVKTTTAAAGLLATTNFAYAAGSDRMTVGVVGTGGRGTGAARDAVEAAEGVEVIALADLFDDRLQASEALLKEAIGGALRVEGRRYSGFDGYLRVLDDAPDYVILATPPGFRPMHFEACVEAGRHVFMEKPAAVDPAGVRRMIAAGEAADAAGLSVVTGTIYRRQPSFVEAVQQIHDGAIGKITAAQAYYLTGTLWERPRLPGMSDMEWQCRNWMYFTWLSGDHIVEQFVHNLDILNWVMGANPERAIGMGGRLVRTDPSFGHIYDHFSVEYIYPGGVVAEAKCRQMEGATRRVTNRIIGTEGVAELHPSGSTITAHDGTVIFRYGERGGNGYVLEHTDLINAIRSRTPINETRQIADSTLVGILGRESAYTGQELTWEEVEQADQDLFPQTVAFGALPFPAVPTPGLTRLDRTDLAG